jgi:hypothetical protein
VTDGTAGASADGTAGVKAVVVVAMRGGTAGVNPVTVTAGETMTLVGAAIVATLAVTF